MKIFTITMGTNGGDTITTGDERDLIFSRDGNDIIMSGNGGDIVFADRGDDVIFGEAGNDLLIGGRGNDEITGGSGNDIVKLGRDDDTGIYTVSDNVGDWDMYHGGSGIDTLIINVDTAAEKEAIDTFLASHPNPSTFVDFSSLGFNLTAKRFENYEVNVLNASPTDILLSNNTVGESLVTGNVIGILTAVDPDIGDTADFNIVSDPDNKFDIVGDELRLDNALNFETAESHSVEIKVTDSAGNMFMKNFTINVTDVQEAPSLMQESFIIPEESGNGTVVGQVTATDEDSGALSFSITGGDPNNVFSIDSIDDNTAEITITNASAGDLDADDGSLGVANLQITVSDGILTDMDNFLVSVAPVNEGGLSITSPNSLVVPENSTFVVNVTTSDSDVPADPVILSFSGGVDDALFTLTPIIDPVLGYSISAELNFINPPDFENPADSNGDNTYFMALLASDIDGNSVPSFVRIAVTDVAPLFTSGADTVDYNTVTNQQVLETPNYDALGGNDNVTLPDAANAAASYDASNTFKGGAGDDTITAGDLGDTIEGGAGNDTFVLAPGDGMDEITDFEATNDNEKIDLSSFGINISAGATDVANGQFVDYQDFEDNIVDDSSGTPVVNLDLMTNIATAGDQITLTGTSNANLDANDFSF